MITLILNGAHLPLHEEVDAERLDVIEGRIPTDLNGVYFRNTQNQIHQPVGRFQPFDGDGMIHAISFRDGKASYRNRVVRTKGFIAEQEAGGSIWAGTMENPKKSRRPDWGSHGAIKDASSTDVVVHAGQVLSTYYQCGEGYRLHANWRFNLQTGATREGRLDERILEFGMINQRIAGEPYRYAYSAQAKLGWFLFTGLVKHDLKTGASGGAHGVKEGLLFVTRPTLPGILPPRPRHLRHDVRKHLLEVFRFFSSKKEGPTRT